MIVLYNPWSTPSRKTPLPMSLLAVASTLGERPWEIVDGNLDSDPVASIVELARERSATAVGITVMPGPQLERAVPDSRRLAAALPGVPIIWGGYFPSQHAQTVLEDGAVGFCVRGQGERTLPSLLETLEHGGSLAAIPGLSYRLDGHVHHNPSQPLLDLDELPPWPYGAIPMERYLHRHYLGERVFTHQSSYGCPFACNFCAIVAIANRKWVAQSAATVDSILRQQRQRWGIDAVQFHDMDFFIAEARVAELCERIAPVGLSWWALGRIDELMRYRDSTWQAMQRSGLRMLFCGAEAGSDEVLVRLNKGGTATAEKAVELVQRMRQYGVIPEYSFVLGNPPDPLVDVDQTIAFIRRLKRANPATEIILYLYTPVPLDGTLWEEARNLGFKFPDDLDGWISGDWRAFAFRRDPVNPWLDPRLKRRVRDFERVLNAYYPTTTDLTLRGLKRFVLRALSAWRYRLEVYGHPVELRLFHRLFRYQRPETAGF